MRFVDAIGGVHKQDVTEGGHATAAHVVLGDTQLGHHVVYPDRIRFILVGG